MGTSGGSPRALVGDRGWWETDIYHAEGVCVLSLLSGLWREKGKQPPLQKRGKKSRQAGGGWRSACLRGGGGVGVDGACLVTDQVSRS